MSKVLGIDAGSGFCCMAIMEGGKPKVIPNSDGARTTPSIVAWTKTGERLIGQAAKRQAVTNPKNTVYEIKRFIGRKFSEVTESAKLMPYEIVAAENGDCRVKIDGKLYSPEEITSFILSKLKADAEAYLGEKIVDAVITVPAYFTSEQKEATRNAGIIAGFNVLRIINEPTSAALAYGIDKKGDRTIAIADVGSSTTDFSILELGSGVFEVKAVNGDNLLGGKNYDEKIMEWLIAEFKNESGIDLSKDAMAIQRLKDEAEKAKIALSTAETVDVNLPFISADATGPKHLVRTLTRVQFERLIEDLNARYVNPVKQCIADANVNKIDEVILVGGSTRIPSIQAKIKDLFGMEPSKSVNLDEAVAEGAAIQGSILTGQNTDILLLDVTPLDIGIETMGQINTVLIPRNTTIPTKKSQVFSTAVDNQPAITVRICQGNRKLFADNKLLGQFNLDGIPPAPRGVPQEEISIEIDANGIINVNAKDLGTNKEAHITITSSSGLSKEEIEKAKADAEAHAAEDEKRLELVNKKNAADGQCFAIEKAFRDAGDKLTAEDKKPVEDEIAKVKEAIKTDDVTKIDSAVEALNKAYEPVIKKLYPQEQAGENKEPQFSKEQMEQMMKDPKFAQMFGGANGANAFTDAANSSTKKPDDGTVDAEFC